MRWLVRLVLAAVAVVGSSAVRVEAAPRVLWEWKADDGIAGWIPNAQIVDVTVSDGTLRFRTAGADPILEHRALLDVAASAWQAFEVRMKADRDGTVELFWTNTTTGKYGGFSGEMCSRFAVRGDGRWRTYRVLPFWQGARRIIKLRFDPYDGASFALEFMRIVGLDRPVGGKGLLTMPADIGALMPLTGVRSNRTPEGLLLTLTEPGGIAITGMGTPDARRDSFVTLRLVSRGPRRASVLFASSEAFGLQEVPINLIADGRDHIYNVDMLGHAAWRGSIQAIGIRPGTATGDGVVVRSLALRRGPGGPPEVRVESLAVEDALPRVGMPVTVAARLTNGGGIPAHNVRPALVLPSGAKALSPLLGSARTLRFGEEETWRWRVVFPRKGVYTVGLKPTARSGTAALADVSVTPRPAVARASYVPEPRPVRGKLDVGVYYFPGWRGPGQWAPISRYPERRPVLGWYAEGDPVIADWHVKWAVEHGITFFAYDWYWSQGARSLEHALHEGLFRSRYGKMLQFCLLWANHNAPNTSSRDDLLAVTRYWIENYFRRPEYYRIEEKPVVIIFTPYRIRSDMGSEAVREAFEAMRAECVAAGLKGLYLIACVGGDAGEARVAAREGYDAISAYNWPGLAAPGGQKWVRYADLLPPHKAHWERLAEVSPIPILTPVSGGWDSRPWHGDSALVLAGRTPALFRRHLEEAKRFVEEHPGKALPAVIVEAWNEWGEGSYIEPQQEFGFGYLDAIREVFTDAPRAHVDLAPSDVGLTVPQVDLSTAGRRTWSFQKDSQGWDSIMNMSDVRVRDGALTALSTGPDPAFFGPPMQLQASARGTLVLRMKLEASDGQPFEDTAQVFWTTRTTPTSEAASVRFPVKADGEWHEYRVVLTKNPRWRGVITSLRLDPCTRGNVTVALSKIELR